MELKICHLYPDILSLNGDRGNILSLTRRLEARGITANLTLLPAGKANNLTGFDLFFIGGGQDFQMDALAADLEHRAANIRAAAEDGKTFLAICGGYIAMGRSFTEQNGTEHKLIAAIDAYTVDKPRRLTGNCLFSLADSMVVGFEHHSGHTYLGSCCAPMGQIISGYGNNSEDGIAGGRQNNVFGTYVNGPLLPKNPEFADMILRTALERKYGTTQLEPLEDRFELAAHKYMVERLSKNEAHL